MSEYKCLILSHWLIVNEKKTCIKYFNRLRLSPLLGAHWRHKMTSHRHAETCVRGELWLVAQTRHSLPNPYILGNIVCSSTLEWVLHTDESNNHMIYQHLCTKFFSWFSKKPNFVTSSEFFIFSVYIFISASIYTRRQCPQHTGPQMTIWFVNFVTFYVDKYLSALTLRLEFWY